MGLENCSNPNKLTEYLITRKIKNNKNENSKNNSNCMKTRTFKFNRFCDYIIKINIELPKDFQYQFNKSQKI